MGAPNQILKNARTLKCAQRAEMDEARREMRRIIREKGSIRYYGKEGWSKLVRVDYHGSKEVPTGTCMHILKSAGIRP